MFIFNLQVLCSGSFWNKLGNHKFNSMFMVALNGKNIFKHNQVPVNTYFFKTVLAGFLDNIMMVALSTANQGSQYLDAGVRIFLHK